MPICAKCNKPFPLRGFVDGKEKDFHTRKHCLSCCPFGTRKFGGKRSPYGHKMKGNKVLVKCKVCHKDFYTKNAAHECPCCSSRRIRSGRKQMAINIFGGKCCICGYSKSKKALNFHHLCPDTKKMSLSYNWEKSLDRVMEELKKCILLCSNCHAEVHDGITKIPDNYVNPLILG
jgi:hypothetical protein